MILICGGNIDTTIFGRCLERGLASEGRLLRFTVELSDRPGGVLELCKLLARLGVSIKDIMHERAWLTDTYSVEVSYITYFCISTKIKIMYLLKFFQRLKLSVRQGIGRIQSY